MKSPTEQEGSMISSLIHEDDVGVLAAISAMKVDRDANTIM